MVVKVLVKTLTRKSIEVDLRRLTGEDLKKRVCETEGIPIDQQRLIFDGKQIEDGRLLSEYGIQHMSVVHTVLRLLGGGNTEVIEDEESEDEKKSEDEESEDEESEDESGNMGDRDGRNISMEHLSNFNKCSLM